MSSFYMYCSFLRICKITTHVVQNLSLILKLGQLAREDIYVDRHNKNMY